MTKQPITAAIACTLMLILGVAGGRVLAALWQTASAPPVTTHVDHSELLEAADADLVLFSLSTCRYCRDARAWLGRNDVAFVELVIDESATARSAFDRLDEPALPVLVARDRLIRGFAPEAYAELLAARER